MPLYQNMDLPLFPLKIFIKNLDGSYDDPITVASIEQLIEPEIRAIILMARDLGKEVIFTDPFDFCVFHARGRTIIFDGKEICTEQVSK